MKKLVLVSGLIAFIYGSNSFGWGGRGHNSICEAAVYLVKSPELKEYLMSKPHVMGHLCNIPDIYWKSLPSDLRKVGDTSHYINAEKLGLKISDVPTEYKKIIETYTGKPNKENASQTLFSIPDDFGSSWWRADQFFRLAIESGKKAKVSELPKDFKEEQNADLPYNKATYGMIVNMGLMGHFVGDNGQPFHNTSDHDGYGANHGGIHSFYEDAAASQFGVDLTERIVKKAKEFKAQPFVQKPTVIENMRALSEISFAEVKDIIKADILIKPSSLTIEKGMSLKKPAERKSAAEAYKKFDKLILKEMARSSYLLAYLWDEIYKAAGEPNFKSYKSYLYPFTPDFVKPDYYDPAVSVVKEQK